MLAILVYLSLVAACVVVGMTYGRWSVGSCCGCTDCTTYIAEQVFADDYNLDNWTTSGSVTLQGGDRMRIAAGAWAEWNTDGPTRSGLNFRTIGLAGDFKVHIAHGNSDGFYGQFNQSTGQTLNLYNHAGTKLNTFEAVASNLESNIRYDGSLLSAQSDASGIPTNYPACAEVSGATGTRFRIEAISQTEIQWIRWSRIGTGGTCVRPSRRCGVCGDCDMPVSLTVSWSGCTTGSITIYPELEADSGAGDTYPCTYVGSSGADSAEATLTDLGTTIGIGLRINTFYGAFPLTVDYSANTGESIGSCDSIGTQAMGTPTYTLDNGDCENNGGLTASVTVN